MSKFGETNEDDKKRPATGVALLGAFSLRTRLVLLDELVVTVTT